MLCQKCGHQEATVHLVKVVFRQKIEEHLCGLCAGVRATVASGTASVLPGPALADPTNVRDQELDAAAPGSVNERIRGLIRLAKEKGYLTFGNINDALREAVESQGQIGKVVSILRNLEIEVRDSGD